MEPWKNTSWANRMQRIMFVYDSFPIPSDEAMKRHSCIFIVDEEIGPDLKRTRYANTWDHWHLTPTSAPSIAMPEPRYNFIDAPGSNNKLDVTEVLSGYVPFEQRTGSIEFAVENSYAPRNILKSEIANFFGGRKTKMVLCDDPAYYYEGRVTLESFNIPSDGTWSNIVLNYVFEPYKRWRCSLTEPWVWDPVNFYLDSVPDPSVFKDIRLTSFTSVLNGEKLYQSRTVSFHSDFMPTTVTFTAEPDDPDHMYFDVSYTYEGMGTNTKKEYSEGVRYSHRLTNILSTASNEYCLSTDNTYGTAPMFSSTDTAEFLLRNWLCVAKAYSDRECTNLICDYGVTEGYLPFNVMTNAGKQKLDAVGDAYYRFEFWRADGTYGNFNEWEYGEIVSNFRIAREDGSDYRLTATVIPQNNAGNNEPYLVTSIEHSVPFYLTHFDVAEFTLTDWWCVAKAYLDKECTRLFIDYGTREGYYPFNGTINDGKQQLSATDKAYYRFEFWRDSHTMDPITADDVRNVLTHFKINVNDAPIDKFVPKTEDFILYPGQTVIPDLVIRPDADIRIDVKGSGKITIDYRGGRL